MPVSPDRLVTGGRSPIQLSIAQDSQPIQEGQTMEEETMGTGTGDQSKSFDFTTVTDAQLKTRLEEIESLRPSLGDTETDRLIRETLDAEYGAPSFDVEEFEDLLTRLEGSKKRQQRQRSVEGRRDIMTQGLAGMMGNF